MAQKASLRLISPGTIVLGKAFPYSIYDKSGVLLFCQGSVIHMADQVTRLVGRGAQYNEDESPAGAQAGAHRHALPGQDEQSAFENLNSLILNLKHGLLTAIKTPEQIDVSARFMKIAQSVQLICKEDIDSALAAPSLDAFNPYIVVHQMMGAVLTELIAQNRGFSSEQRLSLVCAALTRDIGQMPMQAELDLHQGTLPDDLAVRMRKHPVKSSDLLRCAGVTDPNWLQAVHAHHERLNGTGYPDALKDEEISLGAKILAVADTYSAMVKPLAYRPNALVSQTALKEIYQRRDTEFDGENVRILISKIGLLPPGTVVKLKCGEIAVIKSPTVKAVGATVYSIYGKSGMVLTTPVRRHTSHPGYEITGLVPYAEYRNAVAVFKRVWTN